MTPAQRLRDILATPNVEVMPGCYDALSAKLVADAGFKVTFMSGFAVSAARLGLPDTGLISFSEMLDSAAQLLPAQPAKCRSSPTAIPDTAMRSTSSARSSNMPAPASPR